MPRRIAALCGAAVAATAAVAVAIAGPAGAQTPTAQTLTLTEPANGQFSIVDNPPKSRRHGENTRFSVGDALVITNRVLDASRHRVGSVRAVCFITKAGGFARAEADCLGVFALSGGNLYVTIPLVFSEDSTQTGVVVGGTGAYQGLHGTWTSVNHRDGSSTDTLTLTP